ncbi:unnamed protein product [Rhizophagus irregularis]|nr:unnamed protein product [Rhizophagus irregularis]
MASQDNTQTLGCEIGISSDFPNCIPNPSNRIGQTRFLKSYVKVARKLLESDGKVLGTEGAVKLTKILTSTILHHNFSHPQQSKGRDCKNGLFLVGRKSSHNRAYHWMKINCCNRCKDNLK